MATGDYKVATDLRVHSLDSLEASQLPARTLAFEPVRPGGSVLYNDTDATPYYSTVAVWFPLVGGEPPVGADTQLQYNADGAFGASAALTFDDATNLFTVNGITVMRLGSAQTVVVQGDTFEVVAATQAVLGGRRSCSSDRTATSSTRLRRTRWRLTRT